MSLALFKHRQPISLERDPFSPFHLENWFDDLWDNVSLVGNNPRKNTLNAFTPHVDVKENESEIQVLAELPGLNQKDIEISLADHALTLKGEKKFEEKKSGEKGDRWYFERRFGSFLRTIPLPAEVNEDQVKASFKDGILNVTLPKAEKEREKVRKISIE